MRTGAARRNHCSIALGSAGEALAVFYVIEVTDGADIQELFRRVGAMLGKVTR